jgi:hypothetical protein
MRTLSHNRGISIKPNEEPSMPKAGNPNWGKPDQSTPLITSFEMKVNELNLAPDQYLGSAELRAWSAAHKNTRYVPETLLKAWHLNSEFLD